MKEMILSQEEDACFASDDYPFTKIRMECLLQYYAIDVLLQGDLQNLHT